jgi:4-amino-4-deoxy-L-arabinose transferase-like glycosyltransferase
LSRPSWFRISARPSLWLAVLLAVFVVRLLDSAVSHSLTVDEPHYMGTGVYLWKTGDYHFARTLSFQPPLAYHLASLPLLAVDLSAVGSSRSVSEVLIENGAIGRTAHRVASRLPFILLACWGLVLVFLWAREAAGAAAGLLAGFVYSFSPMLLAHGSLAHSDILIGVLYTQTLYAFWRWYRKPSPVRLALCGVSLGLALIAKYSALLLLPTLGLLLLGALVRRSPSSKRLPWLGPDALGARALWIAAVGGALAAISLAVLWLGYGGSFASVAEPGSRLPGVSLPGWLQPFFFYLDIHESGRRVHFLGEFANEWWGFVFFPVAYAIKTPIGILLLLVLALLSLRRRPSPLGRFLGVPFAVFLVVLFFWVNVPMGLRYMLPLYPLVAVFIGTTQLGVIGPGWSRRLTAVAVLWTLVAGLWIHPHYLAYFNELVGGPQQGHRYLLDSNLDWGQDLVALADELAERGDPIVTLAYFGPEKPAAYGIRSRPLRGCEPVGGVVAISANVREELYAFPNVFARPTSGCYDWLREHQPVARPGYSLFVYELPRAAAR